ncbi:hypothetical protein [Thermoplasma volcanium GSS1]|uniref:Probable 2-phosphosulfolactate phosphatase n=1 Tax=Thermoplasma volcanium (strain ATCC 51530 / DSM 4299 / JCM 9571 / NBRC 15438 / GSS1) TaxID=273116 RepID=COMB_THEVO|nr:2-phosphosulfolactate phosphatase family protein [Thermoplasma volcanium]Q97CK6.1 RecName: Full=Probable 2-phosphosulfolactate phosphatase [Thermoplasma volcanium GSS1]BAB59237.1 hypothetical protein [Thermoplasma volcanium GSS1]
MIRIADGRKEENWSSINIIIDIFRSTTTIPVILSRGARYIVPFKDVTSALNFKRKNKNVVLIGEKYGIKPPFFDYDNSPAQIINADLEGKIIAFTSTNGMYVLSRIKRGRILFSSLVNMSATIKKVKGKDDILVVPSNRPIGKAVEDNIFAEMLKLALEGKNYDREILVNRIRETKENTVVSISTQDLEICLKLDLLDCVPEYIEGKIVNDP